tara:strand:+ start:15121 stop:15720 length:600 start_codon:yes stop_codon:yes gene_type:complete
MKFIVLMLLSALSFNSSAGNLIAADGEKELVYMFSYLSPASHAMVNSTNAWEFMVKNRGVHDDTSIYRVPFIEARGHSTEYAAKAYFILRQLMSNRVVDHFSVEPKLYTLFKTTVVNDDVLSDFFINSVDGLSTAEVERMSKAAQIYISHAIELQSRFRCPTLPCSRVSADDKVIVITLDANDEDPLTGFWERVSLILI